MAKGIAGSGSGQLPRAFNVLFVYARSQWAVTQGRRKRYAETLAIQVPVTASGDRLIGAGVVRSIKRGEIVITA